MTEDFRWIEQALLIYGPRKGGTTLFQNLLDGGEEVFVYPAELKLKYLARAQMLTPKEYLLLSQVPANNPEEVINQKAAPQGETWSPSAYFSHSRGHSISSSLFDRAGYDADWNKDKSGKSQVGDLIRKDILRVYGNCLARPAQPRMWCAKEVGGRPSTVLALWKQSFPEGRLLLLARDPRMVARAVMRDRRMVDRKLSVWNIMKQTYQPMAVNAGIAKQLNSDRVFAVCYEDLVGDTVGSMKALAGFLGIQYGAFLTEPSLLGEKVVVRTSSRADSKVFASQAIWTDGLTLRERTIISLTSRLLRLWPGFWRGYESLRKQISTANRARQTSQVK